MKKIFLFLLLFVTSRLLFASGDNRLNFSVIEANLDKSNIGRAQVTLELKNLTDDTLVFLTSTHLDDLFSIESDSASLDINNNDPANPTFLRLSPHQSYRETIGVVSAKWDGKFSPFKVKINLVETEEKRNPKWAAKESQKKKSFLITDYIQIK